MHGLTVTDSDRKSISFAPKESIRSINARMVLAVKSKSAIVDDIFH